MPNWCNNHIEIRGTDKSEIKRLADAMLAGEFCNAVIPTPQDLKETLAGYPGADKEAEHQAQMDRNVALYGSKDWYDFQVSQWGTKWDVGGKDTYIDMDDDGLGFSASFESAWSPPIGVAEKLVESGFKVTLYYEEPGMCFVGKYQDGVDDCVDYSGTDSKTVREVVGDELDDFWCLSENMAQWEEEE
jgi:hypothetical protein